ncbi:hypothetical protein [Gemmiger formicilis]|uniref:hypothetical protein n=1 Tax=Gemmiger formicilis TaxID=745368 RepID=UPI003520775B
MKTKVLFESGEIIRELPDKLIVGETYPNAGSDYRIEKLDADEDTALVYRPKDGYYCCAHHPALYDIPGRGVELHWGYSTNGHWNE